MITIKMLWDFWHMVPVGYTCPHLEPGKPMAKPNYAFQKRQRELAKKQKKEAKRLKSAPAIPETPGQESPPAAESGPVSIAEAPSDPA